MSGESSIQWCDATWNPTRGCSVISEGCHNCYAMRQAHRYSGHGKPFEGFTKSTKAGPQWTGKVSIAEKSLDWPLRYKGHPDAIAEGRPTRIFVNSMSDLFHESLSFPEIARVFAVMQLSQRHIFQILTKRSARMRAFYKWLFTEEGKSAWLDAVIGAPDGGVESWSTRWPFRNIWLGVSAENQERADERIPDLLATPAAVRFVSAEPLIGAILFDNGSHSWLSCTSGVTEDDYEAMTPQQQGDFSCCESFNDHGAHFQGIDWVIPGGESGAMARPCSVEWIRSIKDQCQAAGVACFVKQVGSKRGACPQCGHPDESHGHGRTVGCQHGDGSEENPICGCRKMRGEIDHQMGDLYANHAPKDRKGGDPSEWPEDLRIRQFPKETSR